MTDPFDPIVLPVPDDGVVKLWHCAGCDEWSLHGPIEAHPRFVFLDELPAGQLRARSKRSGRVMRQESRFDFRRGGLRVGVWVECGPVEDWKAVRADG